MTRGFTTGCAIHVFSSQIKSIFGLNEQVGSYAGPWKLVYVSVSATICAHETQRWFKI